MHPGKLESDSLRSTHVVDEKNPLHGEENPFMMAQKCHPECCPAVGVPIPFSSLLYDHRIHHKTQTTENRLLSQLECEEKWNSMWPKAYITSIKHHGGFVMAVELARFNILMISLLRKVTR